MPLVMEASSWSHGVLLGAGMASETTAAATGKVGVVRRDPMAMKPFCGYNFADYWQHWLEVGAGLAHAPAVFHVNWFRKDQQGRFMWPGFGENLRVLEWILARCIGTVGATDSAVGRLPQPGAINTTGLDLQDPVMNQLLSIDKDGWREELDQVGAYLEGYGERLPAGLRDELQRVRNAL
jgi:phosphoenolpyruvate carboxykinase (GTP)